MPIRVAAGALGENTPARDLYLSADHALLIDGLLVQAGALVNGATITRMERSELDERFVANTSRARFDNFAEYQALFGEERHVEEMVSPRIKSACQLPASLRALIAAKDAA